MSDVNAKGVCIIIYQAKPNEAMMRMGKQTRVKCQQGLGATGALTHQQWLGRDETALSHSPGQPARF